MGLTPTWVTGDIGSLKFLSVLPLWPQAEFLRLSLGLKCDWFTLEKRVKLEERSRDLAEENLKREITNCLKLLEVRGRLGALLSIAGLVKLS